MRGSRQASTVVTQNRTQLGPLAVVEKPRCDINRSEARSPDRPGRNGSRLPERSEGRTLIRPGVRSAATPSVAAQTGPAGIEPATPGLGEEPPKPPEEPPTS